MASTDTDTTASYQGPALSHRRRPSRHTRPSPGFAGAQRTEHQPAAQTRPGGSLRPSSDHPPPSPRERLTISFDRLAHRTFLNHLVEFIRDSEKILIAWDAYSDEHTGLDGWPYDDHAYGLRQSQRDADTAAAFETVRAGARHLLATAGVQLPVLPSDSVQDHWVYRLGVLHTALDRLDALHEQWLGTRDGLPSGAKPGTPLFDDMLAEHHAECWSYLDDWATHGQVIHDIHTAARHAPSVLAPAPTATADPAAGGRRPTRR